MLVKEFVNADEIAKGLSPFNPEGVVIEAGRLMLRRIEDLLEMGESFSIETTLATRSYINLVRRAQEKGYVVHLLFFWLDSIELAKRRVADRVASGGHNIPLPVITVFKAVVQLSVNIIFSGFSVPKSFAALSRQDYIISDDFTDIL